LWCDAPAWFALCSDIKERELKSNDVIILPDFSNFHWPLNGGATLYGVSLIRDHYKFWTLKFSPVLHFSLRLMLMRALMDDAFSPVISHSL